MRPSATEIIDRLEILWRKLEDEGSYVSANTVHLAIDHIKVELNQHAPKATGRPRLGEEANTIEARKPWIALGMSRRTWYSRQAEKRGQA